ncbi:DNA-binding protein [Providencia alcalifaciens]|uniref:DNA-binding protein n=1 Tax=Providencia alcalifaciens TaxID=126385 RepID=UPI003D968F44
MMSDSKKRKQVRAEVIYMPVVMPPDYPYGDKVTESISDYAQRIGARKNTIRTQCDNGVLPIIQRKKGTKREVNLYALYLRAKYKAEQFIKDY